MTRPALVLVLVLAACNTDGSAPAAEALLLEKNYRIVMCTGRGGTARCVADGKMFHCIVANHEELRREAMCEPEPPPEPPIVPRVPILPNTPERP